uniref:Odorant receptor, family A, subfamily 113, member 2 n=1 Tax=Sinocyclocheilus grahami TaxID=75366 RepID=A0A672L8W2_SINGR
LSPPIQSLGEWRPFIFLPFFLMFLLAITANSILIYLIKSEKSLHSPMYVLIGVMAVLDLIMPMIFVPNMLLSLLFNLSGISLTGFLIQMFGLHFIGTFQSTLLFWVALDHYFAICRPLYYHKCMEIPTFLKFVVVQVIRNGIVPMVSLAGRLSFCVTNLIDHSFCEHMALVQTSIPALLTIIMTLTLISALIAFLSYRIRNNISSSNCICISIVYLLFPSCLHPLIYGWRTKEIRLTFLNFINNAKVFPIKK